MVVYFGPEVEKALKRYLEVRENIIPLEGHEHALFYSAQRRRIGVQAIENLVKKYAQQITTTKRSHRTSSAAPTVRPCIRKQVIFTLLQMFLAIRT